MARKKIRPLGDIVSDLESLVLEMVDDHDLQRGSMLAIVKDYIDVHCPGAIEQYEEDGSSPLYFYAPIETILRDLQNMTQHKRSKKE